MGYVPKFIHFKKFVSVVYPFGANWNHSYIQQSVDIIFDTYKEDIEKGTSITFVARGTSGAMIAGAMLSELLSFAPMTKVYILIVRKDGDTSAHCDSLYGITEVGNTKYIIVDDFISSGDTIYEILCALDKYFEVVHHPSYKYDMLCISNTLDIKVLKKNTCDEYNKWKNICSRFEYVTCNSCL